MRHLKRNLTQPLQLSKALVGVGSYVPTLMGSIEWMLRSTLSFQGYNYATETLEIVTTPNQDPLLSHCVILAVDMWEHAYYLQYRNVRADVSSRIWSTSPSSVH